MPAILFVCTGNQCRSPVAAISAINHLAKSAQPFAWQIQSAGTWAGRGKTAPNDLIEVALELGIDLRQHRSQSVEGVANLDEFDLILTMTQSQRESLAIEFPQLRKKLRLLSALAGVVYDIADPMGQSAAIYRASVIEIDTLVQRALPRMIDLLQKPEKLAA